jgi:hypothetical protein
VIETVWDLCIESAVIDSCWMTLFCCIFTSTQYEREFSSNHKSRSVPRPATQRRISRPRHIILGRPGNPVRNADSGLTIDGSRSRPDDKSATKPAYVWFAFGWRFDDGSRSLAILLQSSENAVLPAWVLIHNGHCFTQRTSGGVRRCTVGKWFERDCFSMPYTTYVYFYIHKHRD